MKKKIPRTIDLSVVGIQHRVTMSTREMIAKRIDLHGPVEVELQREPDNEYDRNAIRVVIDAGPYKNLHIGYVPRLAAEILAPALDKGSAEFGMAILTSLDARDGDGEIRARIKTGVEFPAKRLNSVS